MRRSIAILTALTALAPAPALADPVEACFDAARPYLSPEYRQDRTTVKSGFTNYSRIELSSLPASSPAQCVKFTVEGGYVHRPASVPECDRNSLASEGGLSGAKRRLQNSGACTEFEFPNFRHFSDSMLRIRYSDNLDPSQSFQIIEAQGALLCQFHSPSSPIPYSVEFVNPDTCN